MQGFFLLGRDFRFQVKGHTNMKNIKVLANFRINPKTPNQNSFFHQELEVKMFKLFHVLTITFNSLSLEM